MELDRLPGLLLSEKFDMSSKACIFIFKNRRPSGNFPKVVNLLYVFNRSSKDHQAVFYEKKTFYRFPGQNTFCRQSIDK